MYRIFKGLALKRIGFVPVACLILTFAGLAGVASASQFYVSPAGSPSGTGSISSPWDLQTALFQPPAVQPGDTIWLRGGTYVGSYISNLNGAPNLPIIVRTYPGEWAVIDKAAPNLFPATLQLNGSYSWFWGFEITNSDPHAISPYKARTPATAARKA